MRLADARAALQQAGFAIVVYGPDGGGKKVFATNPQAGSQARRGALVAVYVV
jgi:hypothetical protein